MKLTRLLAAVAATAALSAGFAAQAREYSVSTVLSDAFPVSYTHLTLPTKA